jgi:hypothetical protein
MRIRTGTASGGLSLIGAWVALIFPDARWFRALPVMLGALVFVSDVRLEQGYLEIGRSREGGFWRGEFGPRSMVGALMLICVVAVGAAVGHGWRIPQAERPAETAMFRSASLEPSPPPLPAAIPSPEPPINAQVASAPPEAGVQTSNRITTTTRTLSEFDGIVRGNTALRAWEILAHYEGMRMVLNGQIESVFRNLLDAGLTAVIVVDDVPITCSFDPKYRDYVNRFSMGEKMHVEGIIIINTAFPAVELKECAPDEYN